MEIANAKTNIARIDKGLKEKFISVSIILDISKEVTIDIVNSSIVDSKKDIKKPAHIDSVQAMIKFKLNQSM